MEARLVCRGHEAGASATEHSEHRQKESVTANSLEGDGKIVIKFSDLVSQFLHSLPLNRRTGREEGQCRISGGREGNELFTDYWVSSTSPTF